MEVSVSNLPKLVLETRVFRIIYYSDAGRVSLEDKPGCRTLFLAADILPTKKYSHAHSKYRKQGLATKLDFLGFKIEGFANTTNGVWFYSVQGLFKAAFEHSDLALQTLCVKHLQGLWLNDSSFSPLKESMTASLDMGSISVVMDDVRTERPTAPSTSLIHPSVSVHSADDPVSSLLRDLCHSVRSKINHSESHAHTMHTLLQVLRAFKFDYEKASLSFPYSVLDSYAVIAEDAALSKRYSGFNLNPHKAVLLSLLGEWLGKEFASLQPSVNAKAEQFKLRHIESIDKLPPAKDLVSELFPQCMRTLIYNWMQTTEGTDAPPDAKKLCPDIHPYVQLILEFANNTLVTGVAHVLYSSLIHSQ